jgi:ABC-2 type transport system permease protein
MNIINKSFMKLALLPAPLYRKMGVNLMQLRSILNIKLTMDDRRVSGLQQTRQRRTNKPVTMATIVTMVISAVMGLVFLYCFMLGANRVTQLTIYFSMFFFMLASTLISDFTSVLIDVRDTFIILPKPVNDKTFLVARLLHISIHVCKIVLPMGIPGVVFLAINDGFIAAVLLCLMLVLVTMFAIFFINAVYIIILRITTPNRFKTIISYFQILFAIAVYGGYQVFPRLIGKYNLENFSFSSYSSIVFYPLYWFASAWQFLQNFHGGTSTVITALLGIFVPFLSLYLVVKYLAPSFNNRLAMINNSGIDPVKKQSAITVRRRGRYPALLTSLFTRTQVEKMGFLFTWKMMARSRDFKLKVYPGIGYIIIYLFIMFYGKRFQVSDFTDETYRGKVVILSAIYFTSFILTMAINQMVYSEKYKAAWIFYSTPVTKPGDIVLGATKAAIFKFYIPLVTLTIIASIGMVGLKIIPNLVLGLSNELLISTLVVYAGNRYFPFSSAQSTNVKTGSFLRNMFIFIISGLIAAGHFFIYGIMPVVIIVAALSVLATWLMMSAIRDTSWGGIKSAYVEEGL